MDAALISHQIRMLRGASSGSYAARLRERLIASLVPGSVVMSTLPNEHPTVWTVEELPPEGDKREFRYVYVEAKAEASHAG